MLFSEKGILYYGTDIASLKMICRRLGDGIFELKALHAWRTGEIYTDNGTLMLTFARLFPKDANIIFANCKTDGWVVNDYRNLHYTRSSA